MTTQGAAPLAAMQLIKQRAGLGSAGRPRTMACGGQADGAAPLTRWALLALTAGALAMLDLQCGLCDRGILALWTCTCVCATTATDASVVGSFI